MVKWGVTKACKRKDTISGRHPRTTYLWSDRSPQRKAFTARPEKDIKATSLQRIALTASWVWWVWWPLQYQLLRRPRQEDCLSLSAGGQLQKSAGPLFRRLWGPLVRLLQPPPRAVAFSLNKCLLSSHGFGLDEGGGVRESGSEIIQRNLSFRPDCISEGLPQEASFSHKQTEIIKRAWYQEERQNVVPRSPGQEEAESPRP